MTNIQENLQSVIEKVRAATIAAHRAPNSVRLLAVSKSQSSEKIKLAFEAGQLAFGENYVQEALEKQAILQHLPIEWHFIGTIQSNKTKAIAEHFDWAHSVNSLKIANRLNEQRLLSQPPLNVCIEVNIDGSDTKSGVDPQAVLALAKEIQTLPRLRLRGLMIIPKSHADFQSQLIEFQKIVQLQRQLIQQGVSLDTLSMGMSSDFEAAIRAGSTLVRIGTAIFGERG